VSAEQSGVQADFSCRNADSIARMPLSPCLAPQVLFRTAEYIPAGSHKNIHLFERSEKNFRRKSVRVKSSGSLRMKEETS
jgi:hypothetical protein